ncbi:MAG: nucleotidyl transferase AbiEii/AbiGii toxin family protein [Vicinamibacterales bacterium]|nr:nucleotidyl transferase AbiEii/AbiGii toxin family protein [Vicinamibacterales bacterium]
MDDPDDAAYARAPEPDDLIRICRALNEAGAQYVLIGGFAVVAHGASRFTKDIDLLVDDAPENIARVKQGLSILADNAAAEVADHDVRDHTVVRVVDEVIIDLMGRACGDVCGCCRGRRVARPGWRPGASILALWTPALFSVRSHAGSATPVSRQC